MRDRILLGHAVSCSSSGLLHKRFREWAKEQGVYTPLLGELDVEFGVYQYSIEDEQGMTRPFDFEDVSLSLQEHYYEKYYKPDFLKEGGPFFYFVKRLRGRAIGSFWKAGSLSLAEMIARLANGFGFRARITSHESEHSLPGWTIDELRRKEDLRGGSAVAIHCRGKHHKRLREWAKDQGKYLYVGRPSQWNNSQKLESEAARNLVCDEHWASLSELRMDLFGHRLRKPLKSSLEKILPLRGKALACFCAPKRCHADNWAEIVNSFPFA